jgi:peptide deformylase
MAVRSVLKMGHPLLGQMAEPVSEFNTPELAALLQDLRDTMAALSGAGIAAPQIGQPWRVVIFGFEASPRYPQAEPIPETVLINPQIDILDDQRLSDWEGCLSVPGLRGRVSRYRRIRYGGYDETGAFFSREVSDFHARVVQHEVDHLDGILFPQRMEDLRQLGFEQDLFPPP